RYNLQLQDFSGKFHLLDQHEITSITNEPGSLMPATKCTAGECRDLLAWLSSLTGPGVGRKGIDIANEAGPSFAQITHPKPGDWPTYHGSIDGNRHSAL